MRRKSERKENIQPEEEWRIVPFCILLNVFLVLLSHIVLVFPMPLLAYVSNLNLWHVLLMSYNLFIFFFFEDMLTATLLLYSNLF